MSMQELNGTTVGSIHKSDNACAEIIGCITTEMHFKFVFTVKQKHSQVSITTDERTAHGCSYLNIYLRCDVSGHGDLDDVFLDLVERAEVVGLNLFITL